MLIKEALNSAVILLKKYESSNLDSSILLAHTLNFSRAKLYASLSDKISEESFNNYIKLVKKRADGYPIAYIINKKEFYGRDFYIKDGVLCPRPDSETLIEAVLESQKNKKSLDLLDLCTGSGALAITLKLERPDWNIDSSDISEISESVFRINNEKLSSNSINFIRSDLFDLIDKKYDVIISNPPYITPLEWLERSNDGWKEPELALNGKDADGLMLIRQIIDGISTSLSTGGYFFLEAAPQQFDTIISLLKLEFFKDFKLHKDLAGDNRILECKFGS